MFTDDLKNTLLIYPDIKEVGFDEQGKHYFHFIHIKDKVTIFSREEILSEVERPGIKKSKPKEEEPKEV